MCRKTGSYRRGVNYYNNGRNCAKDVNLREVKIHELQIVDADYDVDKCKNHEISYERPPQSHGVKEDLIETLQNAKIRK